MTKFVVEIDPHKLACRIAEATCGIKRPPGVSARQALQEMEEQTCAETIACIYRAARAAGEYMQEAINNSAKVH